MKKLKEDNLPIREEKTTEDFPFWISGRSHFLQDINHYKHIKLYKIGLQ